MLPARGAFLTMGGAEFVMSLMFIILYIAANLLVNL